MGGPQQHVTRSLCVPNPQVCKNCILHEQENRKLRLILEQHERESVPIGGRPLKCRHCAGFQQDIRELRLLVESLRAQVDITESRKRNNFETEANELRAEVARLRAKLQSVMNNSAGDSGDAKGGQQINVVRGAEKESHWLLGNAIVKIN